jgi:hypothetical protein
VGWHWGWIGKHVVVVPNVQENGGRKKKGSVSKNKEKCIGNVLGHTSAVLLQ